MKERGALRSAKESGGKRNRRGLSISPATGLRFCLPSRSTPWQTRTEGEINRKELRSSLSPHAPVLESSPRLPTASRVSQLRLLRRNKGRLWVGSSPAIATPARSWLSPGRAPALRRHEGGGGYPKVDTHWMLGMGVALADSPEDHRAWDRESFRVVVFLTLWF